MEEPWWFNKREQDNGYCTKTSRMQHECEDECYCCLQIATPIQKELALKNGLIDEKDEVHLLREKHIEFLMNKLEGGLPYNYSALDTSQTWIVYWIFNSLALLNKLPIQFYPSTIDYLKACEHPDGGYGGGPYQLAHLAPTYAAILSLCIMGSKEAYDSIDRKKLYRFLLSRKNPDNSFSQHIDGETDLRGLYCAMCCASLTNMLTPELINGVAEYVLKCQSYEGGFSAVPGTETHAGYTYCGAASLALLNELDKCNIDNLEEWVCNCQTTFEGGFRGRLNKLVDNCYSHWQAAVPIICGLHREGVFNNYLMEKIPTIPTVINSEFLERYILVCGQDVLKGGLRDKPSASCDLYHTNYSLCGLSYAQNFTSVGIPNIYGSEDNLIEACHPVYAIPVDKSNNAKSYFAKLECSHDYFMSD